MVFENIETLKREFTDKYVVVDTDQPELRRFEGQTGMVKTVNMNGNALVEFDGLNNIGWFDIGLDYLKIVDKPIPKEEPKKPAPAKKPATKPVAKPAAKPAAATATAGKMSVADMLAAARGETKGGGAAATEKNKAASAKPAAEPATAGGKMSVADMLAAARGEKSDGGAAATPAPPAKPAQEPEPAVAEAPAAEAAKPAGDLPKDTAGMCAYCRKVDG